MTRIPAGVDTYTALYVEPFLQGDREAEDQAAQALWDDVERAAQAGDAAAERALSQAKAQIARRWLSWAIKAQERTTFVDAHGLRTDIPGVYAIPTVGADGRLYTQYRALADMTAAEVRIAHRLVAKLAVKLNRTVKILARVALMVEKYAANTLVSEALLREGKDLSAIELDIDLAI